MSVQFLAVWLTDKTVPARLSVLWRMTRASGWGVARDESGMRSVPLSTGGGGLYTPERGVS